MNHVPAQQGAADGGRSVWASNRVKSAFPVARSGIGCRPIGSGPSLRLEADTSHAWRMGIYGTSDPAGDHILLHSGDYSALGQPDQPVQQELRQPRFHRPGKLHHALGRPGFSTTFWVTPSSTSSLLWVFSMWVWPWLLALVTTHINRRAGVFLSAQYGCCPASRLPWFTS